MGLTEIKTLHFGRENSIGIQAAALAVIYFLAASAGILLTREAGNVATLWPANAILLAVLLRVPRRNWLTYLVNCALANMSANLVFGDSLLIAVGFVLCNGVEVLTAVLLLQYFHQTAWTLRTARQVLGLALIGGLLAPIVGAFLGAGLLTAAFGTSYWQVWQVWWIADAMGFLIVVPLALTANLQAVEDILRQRGSEAIALYVTLVLATVLLFLQSDFPLLYFVVPLLFWAAIRLDVFGAALAAALVSAIAVSFSIHGSGPIPHLTGEIIADTVPLIQLFLGISVLTPPGGRCIDR